MGASRGRGRRLSALAIAAVAVLSSCAPGSKRDDTSDETTTTTVPPAVTPKHEDEAMGRAAGFDLTAADVPEGWTPMQDAAIDDVDGQVRTCLGVDPGVGEIGRSSSGFTYVNDSGATLTISSMVRVYENDAAAEQVVEAWRSDVVPACLDQVFTRSLGAGIEGSTKRATIDGLPDAPAVQATYRGAAGSLGLLLAVVNEGSEVALVRAVAMDEEVDAAALAQAARAVRDRLAAA